MSDYGLTFTWGPNIPGREIAGQAYFGETYVWAEQLVADGRLAEHSVQLLGPTGGGAPTGIWTLWGTREQIAAIADDPELAKHTARAGVTTTALAQARSVRGAALLEALGAFSQALSDLNG